MKLVRVCEHPLNSSIMHSTNRFLKLHCVSIFIFCFLGLLVVLVSVSIVACGDVLCFLSCLRLKNTSDWRSTILTRMIWFWFWPLEYLQGEIPQFWLPVRICKEALDTHTWWSAQCILALWNIRLSRCHIQFFRFRRQELLS